MLQKNIALLSLISFFLFGITTAFAQPEISSVTGSTGHKETIVINGSQFGTKDPAAPLHWDDCEDKTVDSPGTVMSEGGYNEKWPIPGGVSNDYETQYRNIPYRNLPGPHNRSTKYLAGGHEETGICSGGKAGRCVAVTVAADEPSKTWWASWYVRLDPNWPAGGSSENYKIWVANGSTEAYTGGSCYSAYVSQGEIDLSDPVIVGMSFRGVVYNGNTYYADRDLGPYQFDIHREKTGDAQGMHANERVDWVKMEALIAKNHVGEFGERGYADWCSVGNHWLWYIGNPTHVPNWEYTGDAPDPRSFTVGGYYRKSWCDGTSGYWLDDNAFRYFDDIYIDTSLARVVLGNAPNYDDITIMEPQIPSAWGEDSIECTVNLGRLPASGVAYLFVFDADNNHNSEGYPVNINYSEGGIGTSQLEAPTGLEIVDIEN